MSLAVPLDGTNGTGNEWQIAVDPDNAGKREDWFRAIRPEARTAVVPGTIQQVFPGYHGVAWFWCEFDSVPVDTTSERCWVHFGGVDHYADVWLNGVRLGSHEGCDLDFALDATEALEPSGRNLLAVRVINPGHDRVDDFVISEVPHSFKQRDDYSFGSNANSGGIIFPVELRVLPVVRVTDVFAQADVNTGQVDLQVTVENAMDSAAACQVHATISGEDNGRRVTACVGACDLTAASGPSECTISLTVRGPKLWSPTDPNLYQADVYVVAEVPSGEQIVHASGVRFGFRDFHVGADGYFRLNGKRLFLKSAHTVNNFPVAIGVAHRPDLAAKDLMYAKAMGYDMVRFLGGPPIPAQLRFCDEAGLMVYAEPRAAWQLADSQWMIERFDRSLSQMILANRNHPSITIWGLLNETGEGPVFRHAIETLPLVRSLDDTRLVLLASSRWDADLSVGSLSNPGNDAWEYLWGEESPDRTGGDPDEDRRHVGDQHHYPAAPHSRRDTAMFRNLGSTDKPVFLSEYGVGSLVNSVRLARLHEQDGSPHDLGDFAAYRTITANLVADLERYGMDGVFAFPEDLLLESERLHGKHRRMGYDAIRSNPRLCGYSLTGIIDQPGGEGLLTEWREPKAGILDAMYDCMSPLRWCLFVDPMHVYAGRPFHLEAVMANDGVLSPGAYPVRLKIRGPEGTVWEKSSEFVVPDPGADEDGPLAIPVLDEQVAVDGPAGVYTFAADLEKGGAAAGGRLEFHLSRADELPRLEHSAAVLGIGAEAESWLAAHGVACHALGDQAPRDGEVILVGDIPEDAPSTAIWRQLAERMATGSVVVFLKHAAFAEEDDATRWLPLENKGVCVVRRNWVYHREDVAKAHPLLDGLPSDGILDWYFYGQVTADSVFEGQDTPDDTAVASFAPGGADQSGYAAGVVAGAYRFGAGHAVLTTMRILENLDQNPAADRLLLNAVRCADGMVKRPSGPVPAGFDEQLRALRYDEEGGAAE